MGKHRKRSPRDDSHFEIGYGKPPKSGQTKPGEVRNPYGCRGKPKPPEPGVQERIQASFRETLNSPLRLSSGETISMLEGVVKAAIQGALKDPKLAVKLLPQLASWSGSSLNEMSPDDKKVFEQFIEDIRQTPAAVDDGSSGQAQQEDHEPENTGEQHDG
jgi:hypothetical protein